MKSLMDEAIEELENRVHILETCMEKLLKSDFIRKKVSDVLLKEINEIQKECKR